MNKSKKRMQSIKKKLMAATSMLLVACIMMVSSTYAWFTLSTAPEVTGIATTVGANGNLEIALANGSKAPDNSAVGDSTASGKDVTIANTTWGNLVDLSDESYGLGEITLKPAALKTYSGAAVDTEAPLQVPKYGADGRVSELSSNTTTARKEGNSWNVKGLQYGVRAIGSTSNESETDTAFRTARAQLTSAADAARRAASSTLSTHGNTLGNIVIKKALEETEGSATFTRAEVTAISAMISALESEVLTSIDNAIKYAALGYSASSMQADKFLYDAVSAKILEENSTAETVLKLYFGERSETKDGETVTNATYTPVDSIPTSTGYTGGDKQLLELYEKYNALKTSVTTAKSNLPALTAESYIWTDIDKSLSALIVTSAVKVNGFTASEIKAKPGEFATAVATGGGGIRVMMPTGSGVISDIADIAGDYSAGIVIEEIAYGSMKFEDMPATMETATTVNPYMLKAVSNNINAYGAFKNTESGNVTATTTLTDQFAYIIDLYFRTNVAGSNLLLQTDAVNRVSSTDATSFTQGSGSTVTFNVSGGLTEEQVKGLLSCIKLVFMDDKGVILANGKISDTDLVVTKDAASGKATAVTGKIKLTSGTVITPLTQNVATMVSVLVYLDGENVTNSMVANANTSLNGTLNLQFASSATLTPMSGNLITVPEATTAPTAGPTTEPTAEPAATPTAAPTPANGQ